MKDKIKDAELCTFQDKAVECLDLYAAWVDVGDVWPTQEQKTQKQHDGVIRVCWQKPSEIQDKNREDPIREIRRIPSNDFHLPKINNLEIN